LRQLEAAAGVSSGELARMVGTSGARVRKDLSYFGQFGTRGRGYRVGELQDRLRSILGLDREWKIALVGVGKLGTALLRYPGFRRSGFHIEAAFDLDPQLVDTEVAGVRVCHPYRMPKVIRSLAIRLGMIAVPAPAAQESADLLAISGVGAVLNFSPARLILPATVRLKNVDFTSQLELLPYYIPGTVPVPPPVTQP
jgi:redox-sensing transcriptional repressor